MNVRNGFTIPSIGPKKNDGIDSSSMPSCSSKSSRLNLECMMVVALEKSILMYESTVNKTLDLSDFLAGKEKVERVKRKQIYDPTYTPKPLSHSNMADVINSTVGSRSWYHVLDQWSFQHQGTRQRAVSVRV